jgi:hypothetical protein
MARVPQYYGKSMPPGRVADDDWGTATMYLTHEQALADYATLLVWYRQSLVNELEQKYPQCKGAVDPGSIPIIAFGGSCAWLRLRSCWHVSPYPTAIVLSQQHVWAPQRIVNSEH